MLDRTATTQTEADRKPFSGAIIFPTAEAMMEAMFGPPQHDHHVKALRQHEALKERTAWLDAADARLAAATQQIIARMRAGRSS